MNLIRGINHVAIVTADVDRFTRFWCDLLDAELVAVEPTPFGRIAFIRLGDDGTALNVFEVADSDHRMGLRDMFGRGHLDHFGVTAASADAFWLLRDRAMRVGCTDGGVTDFGPTIGFDIIDADGMTAEIDLVLDVTLGGNHPPCPYSGVVPLSQCSRRALRSDPPPQPPLDSARRSARPSPQVHAARASAETSVRLLAA